MKILTYSIFSALLALFSGNTFSQTFVSTTQATQLIELYTSEGCSSCPPADRWINKLKHHPKLWSDFIPIAFHVDYWDYIGWKDPFANTQFSHRQRNYARQANLSSVYTPGMLLNGQEWTSWRKQSRLALPANNQVTGQLALTLDQGLIAANYQAIDSQQSDLILNIAIVGFDVQSRVNAGENNGHTFTHDFVVLGFQRIEMKQGGKNTFTGSLKQLPPLSKPSKIRAIVAWVNANNSLTPLQTVGGLIE